VNAKQGAQLGTGPASAENPPHLRPSQFDEIPEREGRVVCPDDRDESGVSPAGLETASRSPRVAYTQLELG
jgi:hypothetical protein